MPYQAVEAELWGAHAVLLAAVGLEIRSAVGAYGTLYELEISSPWIFWRLTDYIAAWIPAGAIFKDFGPVDPGEEDDGVIVLHYWKEARSRIASGAGAPQTSLREPGQQL